MSEENKTATFNQKSENAVRVDKALYGTTPDGAFAAQADEKLFEEARKKRELDKNAPK